MEIKEKTDMMKTMIERLVNETDHDIKCMVIILITRLSNIPTIQVGVILEELYNQVNGYRHDENLNVKQDRMSKTMLVVGSCDIPNRQRSGINSIEASQKCYWCEKSIGTAQPIWRICLSSYPTLRSLNWPIPII